MLVKLAAGALLCGAPQHVTLPSVLKPQLRSKPATTLLNVPEGALDWPPLSLPQHTKDPSTLTPQAMMTALSAAQKGRVLGITSSAYPGRNPPPATR
jgi:hypothetical protein